MVAYLNTRSLVKWDSSNVKTRGVEKASNIARLTKCQFTSVACLWRLVKSVDEIEPLLDFRIDDSLVHLRDRAELDSGRAFAGPRPDELCPWACRWVVAERH